jgi:hypothetical protein
VGNFFKEKMMPSLEEEYPELKKAFPGRFIYFFTSAKSGVLNADGEMAVENL